MPTNWEYTLHIPHDPRAVAVARHTLAHILTTHHLTPLLDPAQLLTSELLGNAIRHTNGPAAMKVGQRGGAGLRLEA
ncbi:ATP-binding protein [Streptomyces sp. NPDC059063]|uniref:ATP-binding protein n=1 Tax=unclassified Streptomyces TaxID=2593676 RepID=UPI003680035A